MRKITAIMGGGDWADASVDHLIIPEGMDLDKERDLRRDWYNKVFLPDLHKPGQSTVKYKNFVDWLKERGAVEPTEDELVEYWDL